MANRDIALALITGKWSVHTHEGFNWSQVYSIWVTGDRSPLQQQQATTKTTTSSCNSPSEEGQYQRQYQFLLIAISRNLPSEFASKLDRMNHSEDIIHKKTDFPAARGRAIKRAVFL